MWHRIWRFFIRRHQKLARRLGPSGFAIRLFGRLCKKTQPKCRLGPAGLAFRASQVPWPHFFPVRYLPRGLGRAALDSEYAECFITCSLLLVFDTQAYQHMSKHVRRNFTCFVLCLGEYVFDTAFSGRQIGFASSRSDVMKLCNRYK